MRSTRTLLWLAASALPLLGTGCVTDVGACDPIAARQVVYRVGLSSSDPQNGLPMYAGQALITSGCGNAQYCHSGSATGSARHGVPAGFDFDVTHACLREPCPPFDPGIRALYPDEYSKLVALRDHQRTALEWARYVLDDLRSGSMPPGAAGERVERLGASFSEPDFTNGEPGSFHADGLWNPCDDDPATTNVPDCTDELARARRNNVTRYWDVLPRIGTGRGREIVRNWLACGAPVIESTTTMGNPGADCSAPGDTIHVGDCVVRMPPDVIPPDPTWDSIYANVIGPLCGASCHTPSDAASIGRSQLDLSDIETAYEVLLTSLSKGDDCKHGENGVVPRYVDVDAPSSSLLYTKLVLSDEEVCGDRMIPGGPDLPSDVTDPILAWITAGAPR